MARTTGDMSFEAARELYPVAVKQARQDLIVNLIAAAIIVPAALTMWSAGWRGGICFAVSALGGGPSAIRGIQRWRRLRRMSPTEAASSGEL